MRVVSFDATSWVDEPANSLRMKPLIGRQIGMESASITWVELNGTHQPVRSGGTVRIYSIVSGEFVIHEEGSESGVLRAGDQVVLEPRTEYSLEGTGKYMVINVPAYAEGDDDYNG